MATPTGLAIPVRCRNGRAVLSSGEAQTRKIVTLLVGDGDTANPFLSVGISHPVFSLMTPGASDLMKRDIEKHFARLKKKDRAELKSVSVAESTTKPEELEVNLVYVDLHTDAEHEVMVDLGSQ